MDTELGQILAHEGPASIELTVGNWLTANGNGVVDCKSVENCREQHVFANK